MVAEIYPGDCLRAAFTNIAVKFAVKPSGPTPPLSQLTDNSGVFEYKLGGGAGI
jgi:hypothetical protein